ncbi:MAG: MBG domain-containing protein, partial [Terracidiphilus sp.]
MKNRFGWLTALALAATALLLVALPTAARAVVSGSDTFGIATATACTGSQQAGASSGTICYSGTNSSNYVPFSLTALESGTQSVTSTIGAQTAPVYLVKNDTTSSAFTLTYTGAVGSGRSLTCQATGAYAGGVGSCAISGALGTVYTSALYGPPTSPATWPSSVVAKLTFRGVTPGSTFNLTFASATTTDTGTLTGACYGPCQVPVSCSGSGTTTVTGTVYVPNGSDPLPDALIYIPSSWPGPLTPGVQCVTQANQAQGNPVTYTYSAVDGTFTLTNVPSGANIPIVVQSGKWRIQGVIPTVTACASQTAPTWTTTMPSTQLQGDIPKIALVTGNVDALECVLRKTGIDDSEFTDPSGIGRINFYLGSGVGSGSGAPGVKLDANTPAESQLFATDTPTTTPTGTNMDAYDMIMFPCQGAEYQQPSGDLALVAQWANAGGRVFATHYSYVWLFNTMNASPWGTTQGPETAASWDVNQQSPSPDPGMATVNMAFTDGATLANWLQLPAIGASTTLGQIQINTLRLDQNGVVAPTQSWLTLNTNNTHNEPANPVMQMTFNTPVGADASQQCGRVLFNDYHVYNASNLGGETYPAECNTNAMTPQEHLLEYALFNLTKAVVPVTTVSVSQSYVNTPTAFTEGDANDNIAITVKDTSSTVNLAAGAQLVGTLPTGVTVNTTTFSSNGWSCTAASGGSTFTCTSSNVLDAGSSVVINVPVQVAANAPVGNGGSLTSVVSGGGLPSPNNGTDPLTILGGHSISWATPNPIVYGTPLSSTQLNASALCSGVSVPGSYSYTYGTTAIAAGAVLPAGNDVLTATFTPTNPTTACPVQTTSVTQVVTPAPLVATAASLTMPYGGPLPSLTYGITGFVNGDSSSVVGGTATLATTATASSPVVAGGYPITFATQNLTASNYTFTYVPGTLTVTPAPQTIVFNPATPVTYGVSPITLTATGGASGNPVTFTYVSGPGTLSGTNNNTLTVTGVGTIQVQACQAGNTNYAAATCVTKSIVVNPAVLTVTADNKTMPYGGPLPSLTDSITGFVNGDTSAVVGGTATLTTTATISSPVVAGGYPITFATKALTASNYTFNYVPGTLMVTQLPQTITFNPATPVTYGVSPITLTATGGASGNPVTFTYISGPGTLSGTNNSTLTVTGAG